MHNAGLCRLSEALALTAGRVDLKAGVLVIESLKKRRTGFYHNLPVPPAGRAEAAHSESDQECLRVAMKASRASNHKK